MGRGGYNTPEFWEEWYSESEHFDFDWMVTWEDIGPAIETWLDSDARILVVGCGNSPFSSGLFAAGFRNLVNVDNCDSIIETQRKRYPMLSFLVADVRRLDLESNSFDAVLDKGCLDNLKCYVDFDAAVAQYLGEIARVLRPGGRFVVVSCHDQPTTRASLETSKDWRVASHHIRNPRWPDIPLRTYQVAICEMKGDVVSTTSDSDSSSSPSEAPSDLSSLLVQGLSRTRLLFPVQPRGFDVGKFDEKLEEESSNGWSYGWRPPREPTPLPRRLAHLESRASGRRHFGLISCSR